MTNGSEEMKRSKCCRESSMVEEATSGGSMGGSGGPLKKGPWTSREDAILVAYVSKHGEGNWNAVQKHSGLSRCGKSCRLRWANHLRPDLKKGAFTKDEENRIIELHAKMGNKWARMAAELPGRTDNEIKNFWNTRIKRLQRAGLPIYPPGVQLRNHESQNVSALQTGEEHGSDLMQTDLYEIPEVKFKNYGPIREVPSFTNFGISASNMLKHGVGSPLIYTNLLPAIHPPKCHRGSENIVPGLDASLSNGLPAFNQLANCTFEKTIEPLGLSSLYDSDLNAYEQPPLGVLLGSHTLLNINSTSESTCMAMKLELPSLQFLETQPDIWYAPASPVPSLESVDTLIQSPPTTTEHTQSNGTSPRSSGLLEAVLYESKALKNFSNYSGQQTSVPCITPGDVVDSLPLSPCKIQWEVHADPHSPLDLSAASMVRASTPIGRNSSDELGCDVSPETLKGVSTPYVEQEVSNQMDLTRPDVLLGSGLFGFGNGQ